MLSKRYPIFLTAATLLLALIGGLSYGAPALHAAQAQTGLQAQTPTATEPPVLGQFRFTDDETVLTGSFTLHITQIEPPPAGRHYEAWLRAGNGNSLLNLGRLKVVNRRVDFNGQTDQPLLNLYDTVLISLELDKAKPTTISPQVVLSATLPSTLLTPVRQLFFTSQLNNKGFLSGAAEQIQIAIQHSGFLGDALAKDNFAEAQRHAEHIVNILDGKDGILYSDLNRDGQIQNPGDGFGIRVYIEDAANQTTATAKTLSATTNKAARDQAKLARTALEDGQKLVAQASEKTLQIFAADTVTEAQAFVGELKPMLVQTKADIASASAASLQMVEFRFYAQPGTLTSTATALPTTLVTPTSTRPALTATPSVTKATVLTPTSTPSPMPTLLATSVPTLTPALKPLPTLAAITQTIAPTAGDLWTNPVDGAVYVYVSGGAFTMGAGADAVSALEQPAHKVTTAGFWLQRTEVTNAQYAQCVTAKVCSPPTNQRWAQTQYAQHPVTDVSWTQATAYAAWAGGRLPSEAEWEHACRGDDERLFPWGNQPPTAQRSNYNNNVGDTTPVGSYPDGVSPAGALDLAGNVWEWTTSLEQSYPYAATDGREDLQASGKRILRGGSFYYTQYQLHCTTRSGFAPTTANQHFGLRVVVPGRATEWTNPVDGAVYVYVSGGAFTMGAGADAVSALEQPAHKVTTAGFWLQRTEVTNAQYAQCVTAKVCSPPTNQRWAQTQYAQHPVTDVSWTQATAYAAWAGGRLPSEAEWEHACRGDDERLFPWGNQPPTAQRSNYNNNVGDTTPVGSYPDGVSPAGALDLAGNVWEWTTSLEQSYPYAATDGREDLQASGKRILRGGSFYYTQYQLHCTTRSGFAPTTANQHFGLRVLVTTPVGEQK